MSVIKYDKRNGKILTVYEGLGISDISCNSYEELIKFDGYVSEGYVVENKVYSLGKPPSVFHEFDYENKAWKENLELKEEYLRIEKHKKRKKFVNKGFDFGKLNFQIDEASRVNISGKVLVLQIDTSIQTVDWISNTQDENGNDIVHTFTRDEFIEFAKQVAAYYESIILGQIEE